MNIYYEYYEWLNDIIGRSEYSKLIGKLHEIPFTYTIDLDYNRLRDGCDLRYMFATRNNICDSEISYNFDSEEASVLEVMVALAIKMETIMLGETADEWFWNMIESLGLSTVDNDNYDDYIVDRVISNFLDREYDYDGAGSLFTVRNTNTDLRDIEIWYQMCAYSDLIIGTS